MKYADSKGVLMVHAAGNDGANLDGKQSFPTPVVPGGRRPQNWIEVGASSWKGGDSLAAPFSNYGKTRGRRVRAGRRHLVDDAGQQLRARQRHQHGGAGGDGLAALLMAYYPNLSAADVKRIILESATRTRTRWSFGRARRMASTVPFGSLSVTGGIVNAYTA